MTVTFKVTVILFIDPKIFVCQFLRRGSRTWTRVAYIRKLGNIECKDCFVCCLQNNDVSTCIYQVHDSMTRGSWICLAFCAIIVSGHTQCTLDWQIIISRRTGGYLHYLTVDNPDP